MLRTVLDDSHRQLGELFDLVEHGLAHRIVFSLQKDMAALTARRPVFDHLVHRTRRQQIPSVPLVAGLPATAAYRGALAALWCLGRRVGTRRGGGVSRAAVQPPLKLSDPLVLTSDMRLELLDPAIHRQQHLDHDLAPRVINRFRLDALHKQPFDAAGLCPPDPLNAY